MGRRAANPPGRDNAMSSGVAPETVDALADSFVLGCLFGISRRSVTWREAARKDITVEGVTSSSLSERTSVTGFDNPVAAVGFATFTDAADLGKVNSLFFSKEK